MKTWTRKTANGFEAGITKDGITITINGLFKNRYQAMTWAKVLYRLYSKTK